MSEIADTLQQRGTKYGPFISQAAATQAIKDAIRKHCRVELEPDHKEALDMIAHKIGRIINGDPNYEDSWHDIAGYAVLVEKRLNNEIV